MSKCTLYEKCKTYTRKTPLQKYPTSRNNSFPAFGQENDGPISKSFYSSNATTLVVDAVLAVVVLANPHTETIIPPPAPFADAGDGHVVPPSTDVSRYTVTLPDA